MCDSSKDGSVPAATVAEDLETAVLRQYYTENEFFLSPEWLLKVLAVIVSIASSALFLGAGCPGSRGLAASGAAAALAAAASLALLCAAEALQLPAKAPRACLLANLVIMTVMGILLLMTAVLSMVFCEMNSVSAYFHGPLGITSAGLVTASAVVTYRAVSRRLDAARPPREPARPQPSDHDV